MGNGSSENRVGSELSNRVRLILGFLLQGDFDLEISVQVLLAQSPDHGSYDQSPRPVYTYNTSSASLNSYLLPIFMQI